MIYLVRLLLGGDEVTVQADSIKPDPLFGSFVLLSGVRGVSDTTYPNVSTKHLSLPKDQVRYYLAGTESEVPTSKSTDSTTDSLPSREEHTTDAPTGDSRPDPKPAKRKRKTTKRSPQQ